MAAYIRPNDERFEMDRKPKPLKWWREEGDEADVRRRGEQLEAKVAKLRADLEACGLNRDSWKGEVTNLLHTRPRVLGKPSLQILAELLDETEGGQEHARLRGVVVDAARAWYEWAQDVAAGEVSGEEQILADAVQALLAHKPTRGA